MPHQSSHSFRERLTKWANSPTSQLRRRFAQSARQGVDVLFPPGCTVCGIDFSDDVSTADRELQICEFCLRKLVKPAAKTCPRCGVSLPNLGDSQKDCLSCRDHRYRFRQVISIGRYEYDLRDTVLRVKHASEHALAVSLAKLLFIQSESRLTEWQIDAVAPVPMHWRRRWKRGINHAEVIADVLSGLLGLGSSTRLLTRRRNTFPQTDLAPGARDKNVRDAMRVSRSYSLTEARILLIDDIMTTGATCNEATRRLLANGASEVFVAVLARAEYPA